MIKIKDLTINFDEHIVLQDIDLQIPKHKITSIVGQSGCGKTVLVKAIEGLIKPRKGSILIDEEELSQQNREGLKRIRRKIAMLFQGAALLDSLNVFQNVALPLIEHSQLSYPQIVEAVKNKLELVGLAGIYEKMPDELSGGMKKRVALARAIILQPEYIIYDEPTTGLDPIIAEEITQLILKLHQNYKITSIVISHDLNCIRKLQSRLAMIHDKKIIFDGEFADFIAADNIHIKKFLGN